MEELPHQPKTGWQRRCADLLILIVLTAGAVIPATYYLGDRDYDERFAWRMFSATRAEQCRVAVTELAPGGERRQVRLQRVIHKAWENGLRRRRPDIIDSFFRFRCQQSDASSVTLMRRCIRADRTRKPDDVLTYQCDGSQGAP